MFGKKSTIEEYIACKRVALEISVDTIDNTSDTIKNRINGQLENRTEEISGYINEEIKRRDTR